MKEYIPLMSEMALGERLRADEATTTIALQQTTPLSFGDDFTWEAADAHAMAMLRTGAIYILPAEHLEQSLRDLPPTGDLPPLPFPRLAIEAEMDGRPCKFFFGEGDFGHMSLKIVTILEVVQGHEWNVCLIMDLEGRQEYFAFGIRRDDNLGNTMIAQKGITEYYGDGKLYTEDKLKYAAILLMGFAINCVHLITAKNAPKEKRDMPRSQRRALKRKFGILTPTVYRVKLEQAGEQEGVSGWHYTVRFLVCGHWRIRLGNKEWVHPYIKGPAGAPWKGRPVHEKKDEDE